MILSKNCRRGNSRILLQTKNQKRNNPKRCLPGVRMMRWYRPGRRTAIDSDGQLWYIATARSSGFISASSDGQSAHLFAGCAFMKMTPWKTEGSCCLWRTIFFLLRKPETGWRKAWETWPGSRDLRKSWSESPAGRTPQWRQPSVRGLWGQKTSTAWCCPTGSKRILPIYLPCLLLNIFCAFSQRLIKFAHL